MTKNVKKKLFDNPRWNQDPGAKVVATDVKITEEQKRWSEEHDKKWKEKIENLKKIRNTQK